MSHENFLKTGKGVTQLAHDMSMAGLRPKNHALYMAAAQNYLDKVASTDDCPPELQEVVNFAKRTKGRLNLAENDEGRQILADFALKMSEINQHRVGIDANSAACEFFADEWKTVEHGIRQDRPSTQRRSL